MHWIKGLFLTVALVLCITASWVMWEIGRAMNYRFSYRDMVRQEISSMVRAESLKEKKDEQD